MWALCQGSPNWAFLSRCCVSRTWSRFGLTGLAEPLTAHGARTKLDRVTSAFQGAGRVAQEARSDLMWRTRNHFFWLVFVMKVGEKAAIQMDMSKFLT